MWELDCEESWTLKNWCFWTVVLEETLVSPLDCSEIQPVHPKGDQSWGFIGKTDVETETPVLLPGKSHGRRSLVGCSPWGCTESDMTERLSSSSSSFISLLVVVWSTVLHTVLCWGSSQGYSFSCGHVWMWELDCEEGWAPKNWCFWTVVLEKVLESPLDCKEIQPVHPKGDQSWGFFGRTDAKAETPVLWPPHAKSWLIGKDSDTGRDWGRRSRGQGRMRWLDGITDSMDVSWVNSGSWWWTGRPVVLQFKGSQRTWHDWVTELNWTEWY